MNAKFIIILLILVSLASFAYAETTATVDGCTIKVTVNIAITGDGADQAFADKVKKAAEDKWNKANLECGECKCKLELTVNVKVVDKCDDAPDNYHCVTVDKVAPGTFHRSTVTAGDWNEGPPPIVSSGTGDWGNQDSDNVIAHEVGHLIGLEDEYHDVYTYHYANADGSRATNDATIPVADYTAEKATELASAGPPGTHIVFVTNPSSNNLVWSRPKPGVPANSLMAGIGADATPLPSHASSVLDDTKLKCPDECCCGDGKIDGDKNEECDPKADPSGCNEPQEACAINCVCVKVTPRCGDGWIYRPPNYGQPGVGGEECEPSASPSGCDEMEICLPDCTCWKIDSDGDGIPDDEDNCPYEHNPNQRDVDNDDKGDVCDTRDQRDSDDDGIKNYKDDCPDDPETVNGFEDSDGCPDTEPDSDGDGVLNAVDNCPELPNPNQDDIDGDSLAGCSYAGEMEGLPYYEFEHVDGLMYMCGGDPCDYDDDNDLVPDADDLCPGTLFMPVNAEGCPI